MTLGEAATPARSGFTTQPAARTWKESIVFPHTFASRDAMRPRLDGVHPRKRRGGECRVRAAPAVSRAKMMHKLRTRAYRFSGNTPASPTQWLYGLCRARPGDEFVFVTVADGLTADRTGWPDFASTSLTSATDARPTRFCRTLERRSFCAPAIPHGVQPALWSPCTPTLSRPPHPIPRS
jgi:hypothetical protein